MAADDLMKENKLKTNLAADDLMKPLKQTSMAADDLMKENKPLYAAMISWKKTNLRWSHERKQPLWLPMISWKKTTSMAADNLIK